jgi:hypothetical protein
MKLDVGDTLHDYEQQEPQAMEEYRDNLFEQDYDEDEGDEETEVFKLESVFNDIEKEDMLIKESLEMLDNKRLRERESID